MFKWNGLLAVLLLMTACNSSKNKVEMNEQTKTVATPDASNEVGEAVFGGGCFWCIEAIFDSVKGVNKVTSGYAGGKTDNPTYKEVCTTDTGHVEVIKIDYDPQQISYDELLDIFWHVHDPTTLNRQGNDVGEQYRSVVFYLNDNQKDKAEKSLEEHQASDLWGGKKYSTTVEPLTQFYNAEDYHQNYYENNPQQPYCSAVIGPKVQKFREKYKDRLKDGY